MSSLCLLKSTDTNFCKEKLYFATNIIITSFIGLHFFTNTNAHTFSGTLKIYSLTQSWLTIVIMYREMDKARARTHTHTHTRMVTYTCTHTRNTSIVLSFYCFASAGTRVLLKKVASILNNYYISHLTVWIKRKMHLLAN